MDILLLLVFISGSVSFVCGNSLAKVSQLPVSEDPTSHGTQYRFQYFVHDERGDYKTQEESGEGGNARGSYAVEEPDGNLRIVQYTTSVGKGFAANIKVDHGDESAVTLDKIQITAEEMRKIIEKNRKKSTTKTNNEEEENLNKSSKSYVLGPPGKILDIVMEQAAAIREIISKEIEAEEKREAAASKLKNKSFQNIERVEEPGNVKSTLNNTDEDVVARNSKERTIEESVEHLQNSKILNKNSNPTVKKSAKFKDDFEQSPVVRVVPLTPRNIDYSKIKSSGETRLLNNNNDNNNRESSSAGPVKNFSFKNRIMYYKPGDKKINQTSDEFLVKKNLKDDYKSNVESDPNREEILLYSPYDNDEGDEQDPEKIRYINVPYEILRPYLKDFEKDDKKSN